MKVKAEIIPQHIVSTHKMDTGLPENLQELIIGKQTVTLLSRINFKGIPLNFRNVITSAEGGELQTMPILHAMAAVLHADHQHAVRNKDETRTLVSAKMFNRVTDVARNLRNKNNLPNLKPFEELAQGIRDNLQIELHCFTRNLTQRTTSYRPFGSVGRSHHLANVFPRMIEWIVPVHELG